MVWRGFIPRADTVMLSNVAAFRPDLGFADAQGTHIVVILYLPRVMLE